MKRLLCFAALFSFVLLGVSGSNLNASVLSDLVNSAKLTYFFQPIEVFTYSPEDPSGNSTGSYFHKCVYLKINKNSVSEMIRNSPGHIVFSIPSGGKENFEFELIRSQVLTDDFKTGTLSGEGSFESVTYTPGLYYRGIIKGDNSSWAALSVFDDFVMLAASGVTGNLNLGSLRKNGSMYSDNYVFFNESDLKIKNSFRCGTDEQSMWKNPGENNRSGNNSISSSFVQGPIRKYFECDYKMYQDYGSNTTNVNNYVTAIYNSNIAFYQNDQITTLLQSVYIWVSPDPYINTNNLYIMLKRLGGRIKNTFNAHLGHLISTRTNAGGGIAWIEVLCFPYNSSDSSGPYAVSIIDSVHRPFPVYTWTTNVLCHEMGHNVGSPHTHSCNWSGGPIDTCYQVEGSCYSGPVVPRIGTIMSYCHSGLGINLSLGFGIKPGNLVRNRYNAASCLIGIEQLGTAIPSEFMLHQNYPNPFNPVTKIVFDIPSGSDGIRGSYTELTVYDALGRKIAELAGLTLQPGRYSVEFDASKLTSGIYFYRVSSENFSRTKKMVLVK